MADTQKRWWDFPAAFLLLVAVWTSVIRLSATEWTQFLNYTELLVLLGMGLGLLLGQSIFSQKLIFWFSIVYSVTFIPWQLMRTMEEQILWPERLQSLLGRLGASLGLFLENQPIQDPILFLVSMAILYWGISLYAGYQLTRKGNPWVPVLISGLILLIVDFYNPVLLHRGRYPAVFVFTTLLLAGRLYFLHNQKKWGECGIAVDSETGFGLGKSIVLSGLLIVVLAWNIPVFVDVFTPGTVARDKASRSWDWIKDRFENAVIGLQGNTVKVSDFYGDNLALGSGTATGNETVFNVEASTMRSPGLRFYWRGNTYDYFENGNWDNRFAVRKPIDPDEWPLELADSNGKKRVDFAFEMGASLQVLYVPSTPVSISRPAVYIAQEAENDALDVVALLAEQALRPGEVFNASSLVSTPSIMELKNAGEDYPEWVAKRYLQLPDDFSDRVRELTDEIVAGAETPYDKANAITEYLRDEITYSDVIDSPPLDDDPIEWFLLDYKKGFCNYYATAEVLMLRSVGVPARMVAGFAQGEILEGSNEYRVRIKDSHAWPEAYFPGIGWVEFEPTVSQPEIELRQGSAGNLTTDEDFGRIRDEDRRGGMFEIDPFDNTVSDESPEVTSEEVTDTRVTPGWVFTVGGILVLSILLWFAFRKAHLTKLLQTPVMIEKAILTRGFTPPNWLFYFARWVELSPMERLVYQVRWMLRILGVRLEKGLTAQDQMNILCKVLPEIGDDAGTLLREFHLAAFSNHEADYKKARSAQLHLWGMVWRARMRSWVGGV